MARLAAELNALITVANTATADDDDTAALMTLIDDFVPAPHKITDEFINKCLVAVSVTGVTLGGGVIEKRGILTVLLIDRALQPGETAYPVWDRGDCVIGVLEQYKIGFYDANGDKIWNELLYKGMELLPEEFGDYSGVAVHFSYWQAAAFSATYWPELPV